MPFLRILVFLKNSAHNTYYVTSHITCGFIVMVRFHTSLRCPGASHAVQWYHINWGEPVFPTYSVKYVVCWLTEKGK